MRILSSKEAREVDKHTMTRLGVAGESLMARAGLAVAEKAKKMLLDCGGNRVAIVCGKGNNGGDGYTSAIHLQEFDLQVKLFSTVAEADITGDAKVFHDRCLRSGLNVNYEVKSGMVNLSEYDLVIDGLLGTGIRGPVRMDAAKWIDAINTCGAKVLAIDIPSGVSADSGQILGSAIRATSTVTMGFLKQGLVMNPGAELAGDLEVAEIGYPAEAFHILEYDKLLIDESLAWANLTKPPADTYKHRQGKVFVLSGSRGLTGAACLASEAALRSGAGLVICGVPESLNAVFETKLTEVITAPLPDENKGCFTKKCFAAVGPHLQWSHVLAIGPGLGLDPETVEFAREVLERYDKPLVIDADGLRACHGNLDFFKMLKNEFIITPHYGEAATLFEVDKGVIVDDPFQFAHEAARKIGGVVVLKGAPTLVADGQAVAANPTGHQGLASGGSGDVLTGIIAGFLAQGIPASKAAQLGVFIHGKAADALLPTHGYRGLLAGDLLRALPSVISAYECRQV